MLCSERQTLHKQSGGSQAKAGNIDLITYRQYFSLDGEIVGRKSLGAKGSRSHLAIESLSESRRITRLQTMPKPPIIYQADFKIMIGLPYLLN
jgi:hypothetical protein